MHRFTILLAVLFFSFTPSVFADDDPPFYQFTLLDPLPESVIGAAIDDTEVELQRIDSGIVIEAETEGLTPYYAYTIWALVFNNPDACVDGCDLQDMGAEGFSALWSGVGFVADEDGEAEFTAVMFEGEPAGEILMGDGLTNAAGAEIHLIVRVHGPAAFDDPELLEAQLTTFGGGCDEFGCDDVQYAILDSQVADDDDEDDGEDGEFTFIEFFLESPLSTSSSGDSIDDSEIVIDRFEDGFYIEAETAGLEPGFTYTVWAGVFNDPDECAGDCDISDFTVDSWSILWTGVGLIADEDGEIEFSALVIENEPAGEIVVGPGFTDAENAEIHLFIRSHGPAAYDDPELLEAQLTMLMGGCEEFGCGVPQYAVLRGGSDSDDVEWPMIPAEDDEAPFQDRSADNFGAVIPDSEAEMERGNSDIEIEGNTTGLEPGYAYTIWAVVFNAPDECTDDCSGDDNSLSSRSVFWSGIGFIADEDGEADFETVLIEGMPPGEVRTGDGLTDAANAEVHLVVRCHGPAAVDNPELLEAQLTTFTGGCDLFGCENVQFAILGRAMEEEDD